MISSGNSLSMLIYRDMGLVQQTRVLVLYFPSNILGKIVETKLLPAIFKVVNIDPKEL